MLSVWLTLVKSSYRINFQPCLILQANIMLMVFNIKGEREWSMYFYH